MHGVKRTRTSPESIAAQRAKEASKIAEYRSAVDELLEKNKHEDYARSNLPLSTKALQLNPELYTAWNYRRLIFLHSIFPSSSPEQVLKYLLDDLNMTTLFLKNLPKVYWIWTHRRWCLDNIPSRPGLAEDRSRAGGEDEGNVDDGDAGGRSKGNRKAGKDWDGAWKKEAWERELKLVEKMLSVDARNFLAWDYRRLVLTELSSPSLLSSSSLPTSQPTSSNPSSSSSTPTPAPPDTSRLPLTPSLIRSELAYTQSRIESNFSNFSAWHQRGKLLGQGPFSSPEEQEREFDLVAQALWTDPGDQSAWLYHRFLVHKTNSSPQTLSTQIGSLKELLSLEPESKWPLDTLVHYTLLLLRQQQTPHHRVAEREGVEEREEKERWEERERMKGECRGWLSLLERVDGKRKERYRDLGKGLEGM